MRKKIFVVVLIIIVMFALSGCSKDNGKSNFYSTEDEVFAIETPYCNLYYPEAWKEQVEAKCEEKDGTQIVSFTTQIDGEELKLFDIVFGGNEGNLLGSFENNGKEINVYVIEHAVDLSDFEEEQQSAISGMLNGINVIISKLIEEYDFKIAM